MDMNEYMQTMGKPNYLLLVNRVGITLGGILVFISIFISYPAYLYTVGIGGGLILLGLICKLINTIKTKKDSKPVKKAKTKKDKKYAPVKVSKIEGESKKVLAICPKCSKKIRVPNVNGKNGVKCPGCGLYFQVVNKLK